MPAIVVPVAQIAVPAVAQPVAMAQPVVQAKVVEKKPKGAAKK